MASLNSVPNCFIPGVIFHVAVVLLEEIVDGVVVTDGGQALIGVYAINDEVLGASALGSRLGVDGKVALMGGRAVPVDRIDGFDDRVFVVEDLDVIVEGLEHFDEEMGVDDRDGLGRR